ncbi:MAG TPA: DNA polymerase III subunit gamma/tau [Clostridiales bacterium]|nr:MAG: hypothetical protein A2Y18_04455 [Clostridiales bacterium GWD2_32_19]HCC07160.1 DNA polymerase III subunit gamma/tau [Clostridiales bacterium]
MSYKALYRKYRPQNFDEVIGQEHVTETLKNQIKSERIGHAYLFCGIRGTGKTSIAKIFAKAVNCPNGIDGNPCLNCETCDEIGTGSSMNAIEIDAASNNGVDNVREIREEVKYMPTKGKYKVYIIDEVHMLSTSAFNALLKTLEEPPSHVIFILATTEVQKIPATILSRCQRFDLKRIPIKRIASALAEITKKEGICVEEKALNYIASLSDGSMRDGISLLDQIVAFGTDTKVTHKMVLDIIGTVDNKTFVDMVKNINDRNVQGCIEQINEIYLNGKDMKQFVSQMVEFLRNLLIASSIHDSEDILDMSVESVEELKQLTQIVSCDKVLEFINEFAMLEAKIKYDSQSKITLEVALIRMCQIKGLSTANYQNTTMVMEEEKKIVYNNSQNSKQEMQKQPIKKNIEQAMPDDIKKGIKLWKDIREACNGPLKGMLIDTEAKYYNDKSYCIVCPDNIIKNYIDKNINVIKEKIEDILNKEYNIKLMTKEEYEKETKSTPKKMENEEIDKEDDMKNVEDYFSKFGVKVERME